MTTSRALIEIADSRRASRGRVEKSVTAHGRTTNCWRWLVSDATRTTCSHNVPKQDETRARTTHQQKTWNCVLSNAFRARSEGYRPWPCCTHHPTVVCAPDLQETRYPRQITSGRVLTARRFIYYFCDQLYLD